MANGTQIGDLLFTVDGGYATRMVAGEALYAGEVVYMGSADGKVIKNPVNGTAPLGVVFEDANNNADVWTVTSGIAKILPNASLTATRGSFCYSSATTAGRVDETTTPPNNRVGTWINTGTGNGIATKAVLQCFGQASSLTTFQWSTSEQVWPFEKDSSGRVVYCKEVATGALPNGATPVAHNITGFTSDELFRLEGFMWPTGLPNSQAAGLPFIGCGNDVQITIDPTNINITTISNWGAYEGIVRIYYVKI